MANPIAAPTLWPALLSQVEGNNGVLKVSIEFLRQIAGAQRMGPKVAEKIEAGLEVQGLRAFPSDINRKQNEEVLLVQAGTPAYEMVQAISTNTVTDSLVALLERLNTLPKNPESLVDRKELRELAEAIVDPVSQLLGLTKPYEEVGPGAEAAAEADTRNHAARLAELLPLPAPDKAEV
jgi:hypothetical protein